MRVLITGGAGFIGSSLAVSLAERRPAWELLAVDSLYRPGSELNLPRLEAAGVPFERLDVRDRAAVLALGDFDAIFEGAAEPAVGAASTLAGREALVDTNLIGAYNCLELAARGGAHFIAMSTSRVYPVDAITALRLDRSGPRPTIAAGQDVPGASPAGIGEEFTLEGPRTLYGAGKLAAELLAAEFRELGARVTVNRCGVVSGPWQMATADQGVFAHWVMCHRFRRPLAYIGYGGQGTQVRDVLHVADLVDLLEIQLADPASWDGVTVNVGGGAENSLSLAETTELCREMTGVEIGIGSIAETRPGDIPIYVSDCSRLYELTDWRPQRSPRQTLADTAAWVDAHAEDLLRIGSGS